MSIIDGSLLLAAPVALAAGAVSFLSPCVLPLVPGYLSFVTGMSGADVAATDTSEHDAVADTTSMRAGNLAVAGVGATGRARGSAAGASVLATAPTVGVGDSGRNSTAVATPRTTRAWSLRSRTTLGAVLFVAGFSAVFVAYGSLFGGLGDALKEHQAVLQQVFGAITIVLGLLFSGLLGWVPGANREVRIHTLPRAGLVGAPVLGILFGLGWTPCIGPTLAAVQGLAFSSSTATAGRGAVLTLFYCAGLGLPFIIVALAFRQAMGVLAIVRRHNRVVMAVGGLLLVAVGIAELTGYYNHLVLELKIHTASFTPGL